MFRYTLAYRHVPWYYYGMTNTQQLLAELHQRGLTAPQPTPHTYSSFMTAIRNDTKATRQETKRLRKRTSQ